jgi:hypothetical protein
VVRDLRATLPLPRRVVITSKNAPGEPLLHWRSAMSRRSGLREVLLATAVAIT